MNNTAEQIKPTKPEVSETEEPEQLGPKAVEVLREQMLFWRDEAHKFSEIVRRAGQDDNRSFLEIARAIKPLADAREKATDCAHKLAPYETPKLESVEVRAQVENRYVIRTPEKTKSIEEWAKLTGATFMDADPTAPDPKHSVQKVLQVLSDNETIAAKKYQEHHENNQNNRSEDEPEEIEIGPIPSYKDMN